MPGLIMLSGEEATTTEFLRFQPDSGFTQHLQTNLDPSSRPRHPDRLFERRETGARDDSLQVFSYKKPFVQAELSWQKKVDIYRVYNQGSVSQSS